MKKQKERVMLFWDHIEELRNRLLYVVISVLLFSIAGYLFYTSFFEIIANVIKEELYITQIAEGFMTRIRVGLMIGIFMSIPFLFFQIMQFVFPALTKRSKIFILLILSVSYILFIGGIIFAYETVMPISMQFLKSREFFPESVNRLISYDTFIAFFFQFLIGFGVCFQFPILLVTLLKLKVISVRGLLNFSKYFILTAFILSAIITPPDVVSQTLLTVPMIILYMACILIGKIFRLGSG